MSLMLTKQEVEDIDSTVIDSVFGYIRNIEASLDHKNIPMEVALICLSYYFWDDNEYFANVDPDYHVVKSENEISIEQMVKYGGSAFGNVLIPSCSGGIYVWRFKMLQASLCIDIGISTEYNFCCEISGHNYALDSSGFFTHNSDEVSEIEYGFDPGDIVTMTLDLNKKTLKYKCEAMEFEDEDFKGFEEEGFHDIASGPDIYYKMAICCGEKEEKVQLLDFKNH